MDADRDGAHAGASLEHRAAMTTTKISKLDVSDLPETLELKQLIRRLNEIHRSLPPLPYDLSKGADLTGMNRQPTGSPTLAAGWSAVVVDYLEVAPFRVFNIEADAVLEIL